MSDAHRKPLMDSAESETLRMRGNSKHGNRETLETPRAARRGTVRKGIMPHIGHVRSQGVGRSHHKVNWVLDADIRGFFDNIDHEWMLRFLEHRIADRRILRLIRKWLKAGVSEDG